MDLASQVQILYKAVYISFCANDLEKGMDFFSLDMDK